MTGNFIQRISAALTLLLAAAAPAAETQWPCFRGPGARGWVEDDPRLPEEWGPGKNIRWKTEIPGLAWSSPIAWDGAVFVTTAVSKGEVEEPKKGLYFRGERPVPQDPHEWRVAKLDFETGAKVWERTVFEGVPPGPRHLKNTFASETPVTDGERVYAYFGNIGVFAFAMDGTPAWSVRTEPVKTRFGWGTAASPLLHDGRLYIVNDNDDASYLLALDAKTGEQIWKVDRDEKSNWATPYAWVTPQRTEIVTPGTGRVRSYGLDGTLLWHFKGMSTITIANPYEAEGLLFVTSGYVGDKLRPVYAIKPGASGDITLPPGMTSTEFIAWSDSQAGPYNPTSLVYRGRLYVLLDRGFLTAYDAKTGAEIYGKQRLDPDSTAFTSSPWAYNGKIFCLSEDGDTYVVAEGGEYRPLGKNSLGEMTMATPAIHRGSLLLRTAKHLYRIAASPAPSTP